MSTDSRHKIPHFDGNDENVEKFCTDVENHLARRQMTDAESLPNSNMDYLLVGGTDAGKKLYDEAKAAYAALTATVYQTDADGAFIGACAM